MTAPRLCDLEACGRPHKGRGLCDMHIQRLRRTGTTASPVLSLAERFWSKVDKNGPVPARAPELGCCWVWTAATNERGYGVLRPEGQRTGPAVKAHRVALTLAGRDPGAQHVLHSCDNPPCVNPAHLRAGDHGENVKDMVSRDRQVRGTRNGMAKLTDGEVVEIRRRRAQGESRKALATFFGVSGTCITRICQGDGWKHLLRAAS